MQTNFTTIKTIRKQHKQEQGDKPSSKQAYKGKTWTRDTNKRNYEGVMK